MATKTRGVDGEPPAKAAKLDDKRPTGASATKVFSDPIHGHIELHPLLIKIIDTPEFQRLRYIKQLGGCCFVFPGAVHSRFEHSIGVCHLAGELVETLKANQGEQLNIDEKDVLCVKIAGLCHDLGHGPFSHMFDGLFIPKSKAANELKDWKHEVASVEMFDYLINNNNLRNVLLEELTEDDLEFIRELIKPPKARDNEWPCKGRNKDKEFLYQIVANEKNGIDVDKWDYFSRDCHYLGVKTNFDYRRFMKFVRVIKVENEGKVEQLICTRDKEVANAYEMFNTRYTLHRIAYQHKTVKIIEYMICDALLKADGHMKISSSVKDMRDYTKFTDYVFHQILHDDKPLHDDNLLHDDNMKKSRELLINIQKRKIYKFIGQVKSKKMLENSKENCEEIASEIASALKPTGISVEVDDLVVHIVTFNYGKGKKNPIDSLWFYSKDNPDKAKHIEKDEVPLLLPEQFHVQQIRVYCKAFDDDDKMTAAKKCFDEWCKKKDVDSDEETSLGDQSMTETTPEKPPSTVDEKRNDTNTKKVARRLDMPSEDTAPVTTPSD